MQRRSFVGALGMATAAVAGARAQQRRAPVIGFLSGRSLSDSAYLVSIFEEGVYAAGFDPAARIIIQSRWANGHYDRLPKLADELVNRKPDVLVALAGEPAVMAAKTAAGQTLPLVFVAGKDPVELGLVKSLGRPGSNATGVVLRTLAIGPKRLDLLNQVAPNTAVFGALLNPTFPQSAFQQSELEGAVRSLGRELRTANATTVEQLAPAFDTLVREGVGALVVTADPYFDIVRDRIVALAAERRLPAIYHHREYPTAGGLMSYGINLSDVYRLVGNYVGQILKGTAPADLPVQQLDKIEFVLNLKTARRLGLQVPSTLHGFADELI